jgi:5-methylthioadenosine/S-adenosylhomocysteine deaminase
VNDQARADVLLHDADYVIQAADRWLRRASVCVSGDRITAVGPTASLEERFPEAPRIDCRGRMLLPGLVNAHNHLYQVMLRGLGKDWAVVDWARRLTYPVARSLGADEYRAAVCLAAVDALRCGTTAIVDMPSHYTRFHADTSMAVLREAGLRGAVVRGASDVSRFDAGENRPPEEDLAAVQAFLRRWADAGLVQPWLGPSGLHATSPPTIVQLKRLASQATTRFHIHLGEMESSLAYAQAQGYACEVAWAADLGILDGHTSVAHAVWVSDQGRQLLATSGAQVVHNPNSNQVLASGVAPIAAYRSMGIPLALGTDGAASNDALDLIAEMKSAVLLQRVHTCDPAALRAADAFSMCTEGGARVLGIPDLGRLEAGWLADIVAVQVAGNPSLTPIYDPVASLVLHGSGRDVVLVMVAGRVLYQDGRFLSIDAEAALAAVQPLRDRVAEMLADPVGEV